MESEWKALSPPRCGHPPIVRQMYKYFYINFSGTFHRTPLLAEGPATCSAPAVSVVYGESSSAQMPKGFTATNHYAALCEDTRWTVAGAITARYLRRPNSAALEAVFAAKKGNGEHLGRSRTLFERSFTSFHENSGICW